MPIKGGHLGEQAKGARLLCAASHPPCRTGKDKVAIQNHTARFRLVPQLAKALNVPTPTQAGLGVDRAAPPRERRHRAW